MTLVAFSCDQMPLYKYFDQEAYARALIDNGEMLLRTLSYFRNLEDGLVRGDPDDGKLRYEPLEGISLNKESGEIVQLPAGWRFRVSVRANDIFAYCFSTELSAAIAATFDSPFCVEIKDPVRLLGRIRSQIRLRAKFDRAIHSNLIDYRKEVVKPGVDWALPERVASIKPEEFANQREHRIIIGHKGVFDVENVECALERNGGVAAPGADIGKPLLIHVGNLSKISELHKF